MPHHRGLPELWMQVKDRKMIARLMTIQSVSSRELARAAGWRSHSYVTRILNGTITTVTPERAVRIARRLQVGTDDLFVARLSSDARKSVVSRRAS